MPLKDITSQIFSGTPFQGLERTTAVKHVDVNFSVTCLLDHRTIVATEVSRRDYLVPKAGGSFDAQEFEAHPERYRSIFAEKVFSWSYSKLLLIISISSLILV